MMAKDLHRYDATGLIGLSVVLISGAREITEVDDDGQTETYVHIPDLDELSAAAAMTRCLMRQKLLGSEIRAIRKIAGMTARELSEAMGGKTAVETISRWESESEFPSGYAEKLIRLAVCERLKDRAPGIDYDSQSLIRLATVGNGKMDPSSVPPIQMHRVLLRHDSRTNDSWAEMREAA